MGFVSEEDIYTEEEQYADWVDKMIRAAEAEDEASQNPSGEAGHRSASPTR